MNRVLGVLPQINGFRSYLMKVQCVNGGKGNHSHTVFHEGKASVEARTSLKGHGASWPASPLRRGAA